MLWALGLASIAVSVAFNPVGWPHPQARPPELPVITGEGKYPFRYLGWSNDILVTSDSAPATVQFRLPEDARQGEPYLYGVRLEYEWQGNPGEVGDITYLRGRWNGLGFYLLELKRLTDLDEGFQWSMADLVNGNSQGYETSPNFRAGSTNIAQTRAVQPGLNEVSISLGLLDASNKDIQVLVKKESEIIVTSLQPTYIDAKARAEIEASQVRLRLSGVNRGWAARSLEVRARVFHEDGSNQLHRWERGGVEALADFEFDERFALDESVTDSPVYSVITELDWGTGRRALQAWPPVPGTPWYSHGAFRSGIGAMVALVVLWVGAPMLWQAVRQARSSSP